MKRFLSKTSETREYFLFSHSQHFIIARDQFLSGLNERCCTAEVRTCLKSQQILCKTSSKWALFIKKSNKNESKEFHQPPCLIIIFFFPKLDSAELIETQNTIFL